MKRDDNADFREHPEWFYTEPLLEFLRPNEILKYIDPRAYQDAIDYYTNPPIVLRRRPIPFVLPIKGSAL